jgi:predicted transcriptional regulator
MCRINLELPDGLHQRVQELAKKNKVSIDLLVATALADKLLMPGSEKCFAGQNPKKLVS